MKIPAFIFIILGSIVIAMSYLIKELKIFIILGILFLIYGVGKLIFGFIFKENKNEIKNNGYEQSYEQEAVKELQESKCKRCNIFTRNYDHFCSGCGIRLK